ncbi:MAG: hypothetical protein A2002_10685 [Pseudomonadales bacterium GWC1_66_9]|nr:MAG: hypothetical protein A2002_10685 [Pseudomonadales bacterium GWC1_66_9]
MLPSPSANLCRIAKQLKEFNITFKHQLTQGLPRAISNLGWTIQGEQTNRLVIKTPEHMLG